MPESTLANRSPTAEARTASPPGMFLFHPAIDAGHRRLADGENFMHLPSLGLQYLMATMRQAGRAFAIWDQTVRPIDPRALAEKIRATGLPVVGIYSNVMVKNNALRYLREIKRETAARVVVGGPGVVEAADYMAAGADAVCLGEGEPRLTALIDALAGNGRLADIPGVWGRDVNATVFQTPSAPLVDDLDTLPMPHRPPELAPLYGEPGNPTQRGRICVSMTASRGCPHRCSFCTSHEIWNRTFRIRSVGNVIAEIEAVQAQWPGAYLIFVDDIFGQRSAWMAEFCQQIVARRLSVRWRCDLHPLSFVRSREQIIPLMAAAGCTAISFGVQSGSPAILNAIRRDPRETAELAKTIRLCRRHNILTIVTYIFGLPGETPQTIEESVRSCLRLDSHLADFHPLFVLPGSAIDRECGDQPVCQATAEEIQRACAAAFRRFYLRPATLARLFWLVLRKNPAYLARILHPVKLLARKLLAGNG